MSEISLKSQINQHIKKLKKKDESDSSFAKRCGISQTTMSGYLGDRSMPKVAALIKIARANDKSLDWLTGETESGGPGQPQAAEPAIQCSQPEISPSRQLIISRLATLIAFLEDTYDGLPSELDKCLNSIKHHLRKNCDFYNSWEDAQAAVLMERRKKRIGTNLQGRLSQVNEVNSK